MLRPRDRTAKRRDDVLLATSFSMSNASRATTEISIRLSESPRARQVRDGVHREFRNDGAHGIVSPLGCCPLPRIPDMTSSGKIITDRYSARYSSIFDNHRHNIVTLYGPVCIWSSVAYCESTAGERRRYFPLGVWEDGNITGTAERFSALILDLKARNLDTVLFTNNGMARSA